MYKAAFSCVAQNFLSYAADRQRFFVGELARLRSTTLQRRFVATGFVARIYKRADASFRLRRVPVDDDDRIVDRAVHVESQGARAAFGHLVGDEQHERRDPGMSFPRRLFRRTRVFMGRQTGVAVLSTDFEGGFLVFKRPYI